MERGNVLESFGGDRFRGLDEVEKMIVYGVLFGQAMSPVPSVPSVS